VASFVTTSVDAINSVHETKGKPAPTFTLTTCNKRSYLMPGGIYLLMSCSETSPTKNFQLGKFQIELFAKQ
jgi:hypothetical protein